MTTGTIFDIREFAVHDGPGIRTTVFLKGCPLRCAWCHNPEGFIRTCQTMATAAGQRPIGQDISAEELAGILNRQAQILTANEGGVTFSGGEPLLQTEFLGAVIDRLEGVHVLLDTSGYAGPDDFRSIVERCDLVYFDLKLIDPVLHRRYTGLENDPILDNLCQLAELEVPYTVRVPLVPGVTDTDDNLTAIAEVICNLSGLVGVNLLAYNRAAGGKYKGLGMVFEPTWDESQPVNANVALFANVGVNATVLGLRDNEGQ